MTDKNIIKALECCSYDSCFMLCDECPLQSNGCVDVLIPSAFALIKRQEEEIERLSDRNHKCIYLSDDETTEYCVDGPCPKFNTETEIKAEAIKEFAERLKEKAKPHYFDNYCFAVSVEDIDILVKEMVCGNDVG